MKTASLKTASLRLSMKLSMKLSRSETPSRPSRSLVVYYCRSSCRITPFFPLY